jgi:non-ribosomal peptide synthetase component F
MNGLWNSFLIMSEQKVNLCILRFFQRTEIEFGVPLPSNTSPLQLWQAVKHLEVNAAFRDAERAPILPLAFLKAARKFGGQVAVSVAGKDITYDELSSDSLLFARHLNRHLRRKKRIGIFLPPGKERVIRWVIGILDAERAIGNVVHFIVRHAASNFCARRMP